MMKQWSALRLNSSTYPMTKNEQRLYREANVAVTEIEQIDSSTPLDAVDALLVVSAKVLADVIARLYRCRVIGRYGTGTDNIDVNEATRRGIVVTNAVDFCTSEMADHTMLMILALTRRLLEMDRCTRTGQWQARVQLPTHRLAGRTLGLIGFGRTARALAHRARAFEVKLVIYKPGLDPTIADRFGGRLTDLNTLLTTSDFVSLHVPLNAQTRHMIGGRELRLMKPSAHFINTARGGLVEESALIRALKEGWIAGAGLDVYETLAMFDTSPQNASHPFFEMENVILTPHSGGCSVEALEDVKTEAVNQVLSVLRGERPANCVNREVIPRF
jgi:D-3-phosphoglycerate dehydrogenase